MKALFETSQVGVIGAGVAGILVGSFYALGVVFARQIGLGVTEAALFLSVVVICGLALQVSVGMLAARFDRRIVMSCMLIAVGTSWGLLSSSIANALPLVALMVMALAFGGAISSVYPLCVAQTLNRLKRQYYVAASGRLLMVYSIGAMIGRLLASTLMSNYGPRLFFLFESAVAIVYAIFILASVQARRSMPAEGRERFVPLPDISPAAMALEPRTELEGTYVGFPGCGPKRHRFV